MGLSNGNLNFALWVLAARSREVKDSGRLLGEVSKTTKEIRQSKSSGHRRCQNKEFLSLNIIHLLDRTETNSIFIWSGKVILGEAKPSPNNTSPDQIN